MEPDVGTSIDELDLPVRFEIETVTLPLVQLSALRAGYVLELPGTLRDARVRLVSYGQLIGVGELVSVGEQLGVRVIEMFGSHDAD
jgi:type III secretion protein Q